MTIIYFARTGKVKLDLWQNRELSVRLTDKDGLEILRSLRSLRMTS